ncbi:hypothetical protein RHSIM_Rhsim11G0149500 [Rhododendron simsii]|uniref:CCHC-type domain-containing protein n=1 Tax=Rhododendron simsii TaxID=118357 RepID=A0A834G925_RHOSS|nr:hypothetical protein RHSIM_Rhsim11G0149500 [Rhododendron simsii]
MEEPITINLDPSFDDSSHKSRFTLVGKILTPKILNKKGVSNVIAKAWRTAEEVSVSAWGDNIYGFSFKSEDDVCKILSLGPWSIMGSLMVLRKWEASKTLAEIDFSCSPFWVQIQGLPLGFLNVKSGLKIAEAIGEIIAVEDPEGRGKLQNFIRVRVWVDITKPLKKGFFLKRPEEEDLWVKFKYERLSDFCYSCGRVSHTVVDCTVKGGGRCSPRAYDGGLRAEVSWLDTINFGDKQPEKLIYPERFVKGDQRSSEEARTPATGGAFSGPSGERRDSTKGQSDGTVEEGSTSLVEDNANLQQRQVVIEGEDTRPRTMKEHFAPLSTVRILCDSDHVKRLSGPGPSSQVSCRALDPNTQYFVEEPDSPRSSSVYNCDLDIGKGASTPFPKPLSPSHSEVGLSVIFNRLLNLKRKASDELESAASLKKPNLLFEASSPSPSSKVPSALTQRFYFQHEVREIPNGCQRGRGRNGRGGKTARGRKRGNPTVAEVEMELVEVPISQSSGPMGLIDEAEEVCEKEQGLEDDSIGLGRPLTFQILRGLCITHRPLVVFLMETKNKRDILEKIRRRLHFSNGSYVDPIGLSGGLALWWKDGVDVDIRYKSRNLFSCIIKWPSMSSKWLCSFVYAPPTWQQRVAFWDKLRRISEETKFPWLCVGDFNEVGSIWEKQGGNGCSRSRIEQFQQLMSDCELTDLEFKGQGYTWTNNQRGENNIRERLDRAMANVDWRVLFPYAQVFHDLILGSDHAPLIVYACVPPKKVPYRFKFESMWTTSEECGEVIRGAWNSIQNGTVQFGLTQKLAKCRGALKIWSKKSFGNNLERIKALKTQLGSIQNKIFSENEFQREKAIKEELEMTLLREEMYQHQRSRLKWIKYGDKNTSFFHATVNQRRQRNQISKIKDNMGIWLTEERDINEHLNSHFSSLFKSSGQRDFRPILQNVEVCITDGMNRTLTRAVTDLEIKDAVFQMGALKAPGPDGFNDVWVDWVMETVTSVNFSVLANGESKACVSPERGLRQGDPLSPYLFLIVKDVLSKLIQEELRGGHLAAELKECRMIKSVLEKYCSASGQMINWCGISTQMEPIRSSRGTMSLIKIIWTVDIPSLVPPSNLGRSSGGLCGG